MTAELDSLIHDLRSADFSRRCAAAERLSQLEAEAAPAAVALVEACAVDDDARELVVAALESLGPPAGKDVPALAALVSRPELDVAYWAATLLGRLQSAAVPAVPLLAEALASHAEPSVRQRAAWALGQMGAVAAPARTQLEVAAASADARLARLAREALERLS